MGNVFMTAAGSLIYCLIMAGISDAVNSTQQQGQTNTTRIGGVDWDTIQSYNVPYLLFYYLYNPRAAHCSQPCTFWSKLLQEQILVRRNSPRLFL